MSDYNQHDDYAPRKTLQFELLPCLIAIGLVATFMFMLGWGIAEHRSCQPQSNDLRFSFPEPSRAPPPGASTAPPLSTLLTKPPAGEE
jgi:hypothetical protein